MLTFIETKVFTRLADEVHLLAQPDIGKVIPGSGGIRKLRWALPGRGKRGSLRVLYLLLTLYAKNVSDNISVSLLRKIRASIDG